MKNRVFLGFFLLLFILQPNSSYSFMEQSQSEEDINNDGSVDILDRLEWERGQLVGGGVDWLPATPPPLPSSGESLQQGGQALPILFVKEGASLPVSNGVVHRAPLVSGKMQVHLLLRSLSWVTKNRAASNQQFQNAIENERERLRSLAQSLGESQLSSGIISETEQLLLQQVRQGQVQGMFPEFFEEDVQELFDNLRDVSLWSKVTFGSFESLRKGLQALGGESVRSRGTVEFDRNQIFKSAYNPNDTYFDPSLRDFVTTLRDAWAWDNANFPNAWDRTSGSQNVVTAILDTGFDLGHPDLRNRMWRNSSETWNGIDDDQNGFIDDFQGWDFVSGGGWHGFGTWEDYNGHGTAMAGLIASDSNNGQGIAGGSFRGQLMNVVVLNEGGYGQTVNLDAGMLYAIAMGADIINTAFSGAVYSSSFAALVRLAESFGIAVVSAAGNNSGEEARFYSPSNIKEVIAVGSSTPSFAISNFSNVAFGIDIVAPGGGFPVAPFVYVLPPSRNPEASIPAPMSQTLYNPPSFYSILRLPDPNYWRVLGTSISGALASGAANLLLALHPSLTGEQIRQALRVGALGQQTGIEDNKGYGDLDVDAALALDPLLEVRITSPGYFSPKFENSVNIQGVVSNPGGLTIGNVELRYREVGQQNSTLITNLPNNRSVNYTWNLSGLPDGKYYVELRARTSPTSPWSIDSAVVRKGPIWYEDVSDPSLPVVASYSVEGVDVDNDGDQDLAIGNIGSFTGTLDPMNNNLFVNDGNGNFTDESFRFRNQTPLFNLKLIPAFLNNDSYIDFVDVTIALSAGSDVFIWLNEGSSNPGYFNRRPLVQGLLIPEGAAIGDIDGDGDSDIFVATGFGLQNRLFRNDGSGNFTDVSNQLPQESTRHAGCAFGDFDRDGDLDLLSGGWTYPGYSIPGTPLQLYVNDGTGQFTNQTSTWFPSNVYTWYDVNVADLDNDGDLDALTHNDILIINQGGRFDLFPFNNNGRFGLGRFSDYEFGDVDRDGRPDVIMLDNIHYVALRNAGSSPSGNIIWENKTFEWLPDYRQVEIGVNNTDFTDWDGDGDLDLVAGTNGRYFTEILRLYNLTRNLIGDVDGNQNVDILDALITAQFVAGWGNLTPAQQAAADVDGSPGVTITDALVIAQIAASMRGVGSVSAPPQEYCSRVPCPY